MFLTHLIICTRSMTTSFHPFSVRLCRVNNLQLITVRTGRESKKCYYFTTETLKSLEFFQFLCKSRNFFV